MNQIAPIALNRRHLLQAGSALLVSFATSPLLPPLAQAAPTAGAARPPLTPDQLDSFIALQPDGTFVAFYGKMDPGQGVDVAIGQIVAEELDVPASAVKVVQGDTAQTVNQGGASGSTGIEKGGVTLRYAAAEARRVLLDRAALKLGIPADHLTTADGIITATADPTKKLAYQDLIGTGYFETPLQWNGKIGNDLLSRGQAQPKSPAAYKIVGQSIPRTDIRDNVFAQQNYVTDIRLPGMLHARVLRPPVVGAEPQSIDEASINHIPGARIVHQGAYLAVLADKEWNAIRAAEALKVTWTPVHTPLPDQADLYDHLRTAPALIRKEELKRGDVAAAIASAAKTIKATYEWPFQSHASMAGACAVVDVNPDGVTVYTGTQKPHFAQQGVAALLGIPVEKVHAIWTRGPGSYGRNDAGDATMDAAFLSKTTGRPVRVQYMRDTGTAWDPKGPASVHLCTAALDPSGQITGYQFESRGFSRVNVDSNESNPRDTLPGQLLGLGQHSTQGFGFPAEAYTFPAKLLAWETIAPLVENASPLRTSHLRDPVGPQINFASESFIDELAANANADPVAFRLSNLKDPRAIDLIKAAAEKFEWQPGPRSFEHDASKHDKSGDIVRGRGVALAQRSDTLCAAMVEIEVNRRTGDVRPIRWAIAHDCGLVINPNNLKITIEGNIIHGTSRALLEEVTYDRERVTSVDWLSYPILDITQVPDRIDIAILNRPELPATGAGEASTRPVAAAIANAIFDATGVRLRRAPFTPERVKAALA
jgi:CO/xanthine dehydrogenase Mo-binding subunit